MQHAYSVLHIKRVDEEQRLILGVATDPSVDRVGDIVESLGVRCAETVPLLLHHDTRLPVGTARLGKPTARGVSFKATLPKIKDAGVLRDRVDEAWHSIRERVIRGVSIGFRPLPDTVERMPNGGLRFKAVEVIELSLVACPANANATIDEVKSADARYLAARSTAVATGKREMFPAIASYPFEPAMFDAICKAVAATHNAVAGLLDREDARKSSEEMREKATGVMFEMLDMMTKSRALAKSSGGTSTADLSAILTPVFKTIAASSRRTENDLLDMLAGIDQRLTAIERGGRR
jgi:HK97 family phage prohead protease